MLCNDLHSFQPSLSIFSNYQKFIELFWCKKYFISYKNYCNAQQLYIYCIQAIYLLSLKYSRSLSLKAKFIWFHFPFIVDLVSCLIFILQYSDTIMYGLMFLPLIFESSIFFLPLYLPNGSPSNTLKSACLNLSPFSPSRPKRSLRKSLHQT